MAHARRWVRALLPMRCLLCGDAADDANLCNGCRGDLPRNEPACVRCALPLPDAREEQCGACLRRSPPWDRARAALRYAFPVDVLVTRLKFRGQLAAAPALAGIMADRAPLLDPVRDLLIPVPLHWRRKCMRGYNQAEQLARHLGRRTGIPVRAGWLARRRRTRAQSVLAAAQRRRNVRGAFSWRGPPSRDFGAILVDDVMTTGATLAECARLARRAGAGRVELWVAARALPEGKHGA
ncbi:MAG: ComF family protein [Gammaproteobacteria bacterium]